MNPPAYTYILPTGSPISLRSPPIRVEYDCRGERKFKLFLDPYQARRFYVLKTKAGRNPTVRSAE